MRTVVTAWDGEIHRNWTAQLLDNVTGNETASDWIDAAIGIILTLGAKAPATVGRHVACNRRVIMP